MTNNAVSPRVARMVRELNLPMVARTIMGRTYPRLDADAVTISVLVALRARDPSHLAATVAPWLRDVMIADDGAVRVTIGRPGTPFCLVASSFPALIAQLRVTPPDFLGPRQRH